VTVRELIALLGTHDPDAVVMVPHPNGAGSAAADTVLAVDALSEETGFPLQWTTASSEVMDRMVSYRSAAADPYGERVKAVWVGAQR